MKAAIIIAVVVLVIFGVVGAFIWIMLKKTDPGKDKTEDPSITRAQDFLPFEDISNDMIILGKHRYRAVLACTSTNYHLKTGGEKDQIELAFQQFLNTITFPITIFLQTKVIDNRDRLHQLELACDRTIKDFPNNQPIKDYAAEYQKEMAQLNQKLGNNQQKKRYIIIGYDDAGELSELTEDEKLIHAAKEIRQRCNLISSNLDSVGITSTMMSTEELVELIYSSYYRDDYSYAQEIAKGDVFSLFVHGEDDKFKDIPKAKLLDLILSDSINRIEVGNVNDNPSGRAVLEKLKELRKEYAGYFMEEM